MKMRIRFIAFFFLLSVQWLSLDAQNAYYDALRLKAHLSGVTFSEDAAKILLNYIAVDKSIDNAADSIKALNDSLKRNVFLQKFKIGSFTKSAIGVDVAHAVSNAGSLDVTKIADGLARFLIRRGKEELNTVFFERMKKFLDDNPEFKTLFPATAEFLANIESYQYAEFIENLKTVFQKDINNLVVNLNQLIDLPKYQRLLSNFPEIRLAVRSVKIVSELSQSDEGILPDSIIAQLSNLNEWEEIHPNLGNSWKLLDVLSQSLRYIPNDTSRRWVSLSDFNALVHDKAAFNIYLGLIYQKAGAIKFIKGKSVTKVQEFLTVHSHEIFFLADLIENFALLANDVDRTIKDFKYRQQTHSLTNDDYYAYIGKAINITEYGFKLAKIIKPETDGDPYILMARNANDLYRNIYTKNYSSAVMNTYNILEGIFVNMESLKAQKNSEIGMYKNEVAALNEVYPKDKDLLLTAKALGAFLKYGNFIASVAKAENAEEVEKLIEAAALPAGSYSIKQRSSFNIAVNGYIGYAWDFNGGLYAKGIYAPLGFSFSTGLSKKKGGALTFFSSIVDVGGIASYRLQNGVTDSLRQEVRLESIFSPSAQVLFEIPRWPIAVCAGWRRTPKLFYSKSDGFITVPATNAFSLSVLVDIPLFTIYNRPFDR